MTKLNMVLNPRDEEKIEQLKKHLGLIHNSEVIRYVLNNPPKGMKRLDFNIDQMRDVLNGEGKNMGGTGEIEHDGKKVTGVFWKYS